MNYEEAINEILMKSNNEYKVCSISNEYKEVRKYLIDKAGIKIYVIKEEENTERIVREIREQEEDMTSFIIVIKADKHNEEKDEILERISPFNLQIIEEEELEEVVERLVKVCERYGKSLTYMYESLIHKIPYRDILYIEKETDTKMSKIKCIGKEEYEINEPLYKIARELGKNFVKANRGVIVNIENIKIVDLKNNVIIFKNDERYETISRSSRKILKEAMTTQG